MPVHADHAVTWWAIIAAAGLIAVLAIALWLWAKRRRSLGLAMPVHFEPVEPIQPYEPPLMMDPPAPPLAPPVVVPSQKPPVPAPPLPRKPKTQYAAQFGAASNGAPMAVLVIKTGPLAGQRFPVTRPNFWLGAADNNDLRIPDEAVSGNHAWLRFEADTLKIFDNHSTNNTWVNGEAIGKTARLLFPGDEIRVGRSSLVIERVENFAQPAGDSSLR